jgi:curved DNA-binding protein CbpA
MLARIIMKNMNIGDLRRLISEAIGAAYDILGVSPKASPEEIKAAYRKQAIALHPDRNPGKDTTPEMVKVNVAYSLLSDPAKRSSYDLRGDKTLGDAPAPYAAPKPPAGYGPPPGSYPGGGGSSGSSSSYDDVMAKKWYVNSTGSSNKFWWISRVGSTISVGWGRVGTDGSTKHKSFPGVWTAMRAARKMIMNKIDRGYVAHPSGKPFSTKSKSSGYSGRRPQSASSRRAYAYSPGRGRRPGTAGSKTTYKIYGRKGDSPAHTRFKGKVYKADRDTAFANGDQAEVNVNDDGTLHVKNPKSGHTQDWQGESTFRGMLDDMLNEGLITFETYVEMM